ncbi:hypothetical protein WA158_003586 [Blastocystis sp. Blastoise]
MFSRLALSTTPLLAKSLFTRTVPAVSPVMNTFQSTRSYHMTKPQDSIFLVAGLAVAGGALVARYFILAADSYKNRTDGKSSLAFSKFYEGGFEDNMTKREAALILGVRVNATPQRIQAAYKRLLLKNHPDKGGSPFIASKINQAKDMLAGGTEK